ncbi:hypothetical protein F5148DRAFT_1221811 [Russula earlei]|uniref:Uncharacterized protein n=1 Tax=Russula earlei TaxID=71964 RepID=A0ACC0U1K1_9AGAM|nr:hypothetical protein F5148DRAFT_1221811 [Russula earlei]
MTVEAFANSRLLSEPIAPQHTRVEVLRRMINRKHWSSSQSDYYDLHEYSVTNYTFWLDLWEFLGIISSVPPSKVWEEGYIKEVPRWFPGARLNYAENLLWRTDDAIALTERNESGHTSFYSYRELREQVRKLAAALKVHGLQPGDRVAAMIANRAISIVIVLATSSLGGIFTSIATDIGVKGILDRYRQVLPKFFFAETEAMYAGKIIDVLPNVTEVAQDLSSKGLEHVILLPGIKSGLEPSPEVVRSIVLSKTLSAFLASDNGRHLVFEQLPFSHPLYILYSSGTTGPPKCIVHSGGGALIKSKQELGIHIGLGIDDTYFQYTSTAWMMWPYMLAGLACGSRVILYEGSPFYPDVKTYLRFIDEQNVSFLGASPRFLYEVQGRGILPRRDVGKFEALRRFSSTGSVFTAAQFEWVQRAFNDHVVISSGSGGTDIFGAFVFTIPTHPVYAGEMQGKTLGMAVEIFDEAGKDISESGMAGELVCTRPHPALPVCFWGDDARGTLFLKAYYDTYPGVWRHGDFIAMNPRTRGYIIFRAQIYNVLERSEFTARIDDSICVGQRRPQDEDERVLLRSAQAIREALSARHVPAYVLQVKDIPYTINGKKIEIAVKKVVSGTRVVPSATVANPESLEEYYKYQEIERFSTAIKGDEGCEAITSPRADSDSDVRNLLSCANGRGITGLPVPFFAMSINVSRVCRVDNRRYCTTYKSTSKPASFESIDRSTRSTRPNVGLPGTAPHRTWCRVRIRTPKGLDGPSKASQPVRQTKERDLVMDPARATRYKPVGDGGDGEEKKSGHGPRERKTKKAGVRDVRSLCECFGEEGTIRTLGRSGDRLPGLSPPVVPIIRYYTEGLYARNDVVYWADGTTSTSAWRFEKLSSEVCVCRDTFNDRFPRAEHAQPPIASTSSHL